jgi:hypothetical protein
MLSRGILPGSLIVALLIGVITPGAGTTLPARVIVIATSARTAVALSVSELLTRAPVVFKGTPLISSPVLRTILLKAGSAASSPVLRTILLEARRAIGVAIMGSGTILLKTGRTVIRVPGAVAIG